ncbi:CIDE-N domain [Popillia japonica]|uniref:CIDE-N domain n=1 Tax=Popillia japonica TaxID=7064 RepID=A0AAW1JYZ2_POPJA
MKIYKVWSVDRTKKVFVVIKETHNILEQLVLEASRKLDINGAQIVTESDVTLIDEDEVLQGLETNEPLILLEPGQTYQERCSTPVSRFSAFSSLSTVTLNSGPTSPIVDISSSNIHRTEEDKTFESVNSSESQNVRNYLPLIFLPATTDANMIDPSIESKRKSIENK